MNIKLLSLPALLLASMFGLQAQVKHEITLGEAGTLSAEMSALQKEEVAELILKGQIDARDFKVLRDSLPLLSKLDLAEANILAYSGVEGTSPDTLAVTYGENQIPTFAFLPTNGDINLALTEVTLPNSAKSIGELSFGFCAGLERVVLPEGIESINSDAFLDCFSLKEISIPNSLNYLGASVFEGCTSLIGPITVPEGIASIYEHTFLNCKSLTGVKLPSTLLAIGGMAFYNCNALTGEMLLPEGVAKVDSAAFYGCYGLTELVLPSTLADVQGRAFAMCEGLTKITSKMETLPLMKDSVFLGVNYDKCELIVPEGLLSVYQEADQWKAFFGIEDDAPTHKNESTSSIKVWTAGRTVFVEAPEEIAEVSLVDVNGATVLRKRVAGHNVKIETNRSGFFMLQVRMQNEQVQNLKLIL